VARKNPKSVLCNRGLRKEEDGPRTRSIGSSPGLIRHLLAIPQTRDGRVLGFRKGKETKIGEGNKWSSRDASSDRGGCCFPFWTERVAEIYFLPFTAAHTGIGAVQSAGLIPE
jgi:hypothetical protein